MKIPDLNKHGFPQTGQKRIFYNNCPAYAKNTYTYVEDFISDKIADYPEFSLWANDEAGVGDVAVSMADYDYVYTCLLIMAGFADD